jgi:hypothetical protein
VERYKVILTNLRTGAVHTCKYLPENLSGIKLVKTMNMDIPFGYSVEASAETVRLVSIDAEFVRTEFLQQMQNTRIQMTLQYLNRMATGYDTIFTALINARNIKVWDIFTEVSLLDNDTQDAWKSLANIEKSISSLPSGSPITFPSMPLYEEIAFSIKSDDIGQQPADLRLPITERGVKIYSPNLIVSFGDRWEYLLQIRSAEAATVRAKITRTVDVSMAGVRFYCYKREYNSNTDLEQRPKYTEFAQGNISVNLPAYDIVPPALDTASKEFIINIPAATTLQPAPNNTVNYVELAYRFVILSSTNQGENQESKIPMNFSGNIEIIHDSQTPAFTKRMYTIQDMLDNLVGVGKYTYYKRRDEWSQDVSPQFISGDMLYEVANPLLTIKPKDFLMDYCKIHGYTFYFDSAGMFHLMPIEQYIAKQSEQVTNFNQCKDFEISLNEECLYAGINVGEDAPNISEYSTVRQSFCEILNYRIDNNGGSEKVFDLASSKIKTDYCSILFSRYMYENSEGSDTEKRYKDVYMVMVDEVDNILEQQFSANKDYIGAFNVYLSPARRAMRFSQLFQVFSTENMRLLGQENTINNLRSSVEWHEYSDLVEEKGEFLQKVGTPVFTPKMAKFTTLGNIANIDVFSKVTVINKGITYTGIVTDVETTNKLEELEIKMQLIE